MRDNAALAIGALTLLSGTQMIDELIKGLPDAKLQLIRKNMNEIGDLTPSV